MIGLRSLSYWSLAPLVIAIVSPARAADPVGSVTILKAPEGGIQPQAAIDGEGVIHLIHFRGDPAGGDLFYSRFEVGRDHPSDPIRVNSQPGAAVAAGTIRGGQIALGRGGRVHVAWNGSRRARPENPIEGVPMLYTRLDPNSGRFEPQRNLMRRTSGLDGGGTVAADREGNVYVGWHGREPSAPEGEAGRRFYLARSDDDGATFAPERPTFERSTGACACCGTRAFVDGKGVLHALYRAATDVTERDTILLRSRDRGRSFDGLVLDPWTIGTCPMSSMAMAEGPEGVVIAAWETEGQIFFCRIDPESGEPSHPISPPGEGGRKHPSVAVNARGETILVWAEGTGWKRGGALAWQVFDPSGRPTAGSGRIAGGIPTWGLATVVARPDGGFAIIH